MGYYDKQFDASDLDLGSPLTKKQRKKITKLTQKADFYSATVEDDNTITLDSWEEYDCLITFLKKVVTIKQDISTHIIIEDTKEEAYWIIEIIGREIIECFGTVIWGNTEDKLKIKNALTAHLEATDEVISDIVEHIIVALKGGYDDINDTEPGEESEPDSKSEPTKKDLAQIEQEEGRDPAANETPGEREERTTTDIIGKV